MKAKNDKVSVIVSLSSEEIHELTEYLSVRYVVCQGGFDNLTIADRTAARVLAAIKDKEEYLDEKESVVD